MYTHTHTTHSRTCLHCLAENHQGSVIPAVVTICIHYHILPFDMEFTVMFHYLTLGRLVSFICIYLQTSAS